MLGGKASAKTPITKQHGEKMIAARHGLPPYAAHEQKKEMYDVEAKAFDVLQKPKATLGDFFKSIGAIPDDAQKREMKSTFRQQDPQNQQAQRGSAPDPHLKEEAVKYRQIITPEGNLRLVEIGPSKQDQPHAPIYGENDQEIDQTTLSPSQYGSNPGWFESLDKKAQKIGRGVLGPAYEPSMAMLRLAAAFSPGQDVKDMLDGSADMSDAVMAQDGVKFAEASAMLGGSLAAIFLPGSYGGVKKSGR